MYLLSEHYAAISPCPPLTQHTVETLLEKGSGELNEDVLLHTDRLFGVFDGATSLDKMRFAGGRTGGLLAAETAASAFRHGPGNLLHTAENANRHIREALHNHNISLTERHRLWSTSMAVVRLGADHFEYCQTGDSMILLIRDDGAFRLLTPELDIDRKTLQLWRESDATSPQTIHDLLAAQIRQVRLQMNISYGVLNGEPEAIRFLNHGREQLDRVTDILIFTDGLFLPRADLQQEHDWRAFVQLYRQGGLNAIRDQVRFLQRQDPAGRIYPRFKLHDDIAAVAVRLNS
jgi:hypothetical protein